MVFSFGPSIRDRVEIAVLRYERQPIGDYHDDNWLTVKVRACVGAFRGSVDAAILTEELLAFLGQLRPLYASLTGVAEFTTLERQLHLRLKGDGKGNVQLVGEVADQPAIGNRLHFTLHFDQSQLGESIHELQRVISEFPIRMG